MVIVHCDDKLSGGMVYDSDVCFPEIKLQNMGPEICA